MSPLEPLAPDQRAVVSLVLQQGRSYDEIAALLGIPAQAVRARAQAGLAALARDNGLPAEVTAPLADYLLGQQPEGDAEATRGLLAESGPARAWATSVAARLTDVAAHGLPEIPAAAQEAPWGDTPRPDATPASRPEPAATAPGDAVRPDAAPAPRPRPVREPAPPAQGDAPAAVSRLGGVLLIAGVLAVVAVVLFLVLRGADDDAGEEQAATSATATPTPTAAPVQVADRIALRSPSGAKTKGTMTVYLQADQLLFNLVARNVPPSGDNGAYAVWFTGPGAKLHRLGFTNAVGADGRLGIQGPSEGDAAAFPKLYATYANVVVSRATTGDVKRPTGIVLTGKLPKGR
jgi:hypothetical protein